jgi:hypothetical protein
MEVSVSYAPLVPSRVAIRPPLLAWRLLRDSPAPAHRSIP